MFNIYSIAYGWMSISFGLRKSVDEQPGYTETAREIPYLSYLDYVKDEFDNLFNLKEIGEKKSYEFDLEGDDLRVTTQLKNGEGKTIEIKMEYLYSPDVNPTSYTYEFPYYDFLVDYIREFEERKEEYIKDFHYDLDEYIWENEDWLEIKAKIQ